MKAGSRPKSPSNTAEPTGIASTPACPFKNVAPPRLKPVVRVFQKSQSWQMLAINLK